MRRPRTAFAFVGVLHQQTKQVREPPFSCSDLMRFHTECRKWSGLLYSWASVACWWRI